MIVFSGKVNNTIRDRIIDKRSRQFGLMTIIIESIFLLFILIYYLATKKIDDTLKMLIMLLIAIFLTCIIFIPYKYSANKFEWDFIIKLENDSITEIFMHQNGVSISKPLSKIKKVVDYGDYYYLYLYRWDASNGIVCQKDLLVQGTIEEFENLFKGKIVRKIKNN